MDYSFTNKVTAFDFFRLSMSRTYRSMVGVVNVVFTVAMFALAYAFWDKASDGIQLLILLGCLLFPVIQPIWVFIRGRGQANLIPQDMLLEFDDFGLHVTVGDQKQNLGWKKLRLIEERGMLFINSDEKHGYILTNKMLGKSRNEFVEYIEQHLSRFS